MSNLPKLFQSQILSDVTLELHDDHQIIPIQAHKAILASHSDYFLSLFSNWNDNKITVPNAKVVYDIILSFYECKKVFKPEMDINQWITEYIRCKNFLMMEIGEGIFDQIDNVPCDKYHLYVGLLDVIPKNLELIKLLVRFLPKDHSLSKLSNRVIDEISRTYSIHTIITGDIEGKIVIEESDGYKTIATMDHGRPVVSIDYTRCTLLSADDSCIKEWSLDEFVLVNEIKNYNCVSAIKYYGAYILIAHEDVVSFWNRQAQKEEKSIKLDYQIKNLEICRNGFITIGDSILDIWEQSESIRINILNDHVSYNSALDCIVYNDLDKSIKCYDVATKSCAEIYQKEKFVVDEYACDDYDVDHCCHHRKSYFEISHHGGYTCFSHDGKIIINSTGEELWCQNDGDFAYVFRGTGTYDIIKVSDYNDLLFIRENILNHIYLERTFIPGWDSYCGIENDSKITTAIFMDLLRSDIIARLKILK